MLCEHNIITALDAVSRLQWDAQFCRVAPRPYAALAYRIRGSAVIGCDGREYTVRPKEVLYLPQGLAYTAEYTDTELIVVHFTTQHPDEAIQVYTPTDSPAVCALFRHAHDLWRDKQPGYRALVTGALYTIWGTLEAQQRTGITADAFEAAVAYLHAHYTDSTLTVGDICAAAGMGESHFRRQFRRRYDQSPVAYVTARRLEYARDLIAGGTPVEAAAVASGFADPKYFARVVKQHYGCTPRDLKHYGR